MIQELVNYSKWLKKDFKELYSGIFHEGIHIEITINNDGKLLKDGFKFEIYRKGQIPSKFLLKLAEYENNGEMIPIYIIKNKYVDSSSKFFSSNNYYSYFFYLFKDTKGFKISDAFDFKPNKTELKSNDFKSKFENYLKSYSKEFNKKLELHFNYLDHKNENDYNIISKYLKNNLWIDFISNRVIDRFLTKKTNGNLEILKKNKKLLTNRIFLTFKTKDFDKNFKKNIDRYYSKKISLKDPKNKFQKNNFIIPGDAGEIYYFNPLLSQDNVDKPFSKHLSHFSLLNKKVEQEHICESIKLLKLIYHKKLPNPLPIFIDKQELNKKVITLFRQNDAKKTYTKIIKSLAKNHSEDLQNYYLINYSSRKSLIINDTDVISNFKFWINLKWSKKLLELYDIKDDISDIEHIFDIEKLLRTKIFNNELKYFGDIEFSKDTPYFLKNNIYKYRKLLYDAFYKSRLYLLKTHMFKDIYMPVIRHEIAHNGITKNKSKNENRIKRQLLTYIQLNKLFDEYNKNLGGIDMPSELPKYYQNCVGLLKGEITHYQSDEDFAFGTGQVIRYLLEQSESSNKSHAMFEPFLQKLGNYDVFIAQINRTLKQYGHKIKMNYDTFDKLMSNTTAYKLKDHKSLKDLETMIICGYFAKKAISEVVGEKSNIKNLNAEE